MQTLNKMISTAAAALTLLTLASCSANSPSSAVEKVNGVAITRADLDRAVKAFLAQSHAPDPVPPEAMKQATEAALQQLTAAELLYQAGSKLEVKDLDKQVTTRIAQAKYQYASQAEFDKALQMVGMDQKAMEEAARKDIVINNLIAKQISSDAPVTEEEAKKFYEANKDKLFTQRDRIKVSHLAVTFPEKAAPDIRNKAKDTAADLLKRTKAGEDFATLAKTNAPSPLKIQKEDLGIITKGQTLPMFEKAAYALNPGETSEVVELPTAYDIIKVQEKLPDATDPFELVKTKVIGNLKREKVRKDISAFVDKLRAKAKIEKM